MSDALPSTPEHVVDPTLRRRLAWGLVAGFGLEELARREGVQRSALERVLGQPGMIVLLRVWTTFFQEGDRGDIPLLLAMCKWALAHILKHARERAVGIGVGYGFICAFSLQVALKPTLKALCAHIDGLIDLGPPKKLRGVRAKLVDVLCWVIETAFTQDLIDKFGHEFLYVQDEGFQHAVATGLFGDSLAEYEDTANAAAERELDQVIAEQADTELAADALAAGNTSDAPAPSEESELNLLSRVKAVSTALDPVDPFAPVEELEISMLSPVYSVSPRVGTCPRRPVGARASTRMRAAPKRKPGRRDLLRARARPPSRRCSVPSPVRLRPIGLAA